MKLLAGWPPRRRLLLCDETGGGRPVAEALGGLHQAARAAPWAVLIGPEGGFSSAELEAVRRIKDVTSVGLGPRILRADTAALAALAGGQGAGGGGGRPPPALI